MMKLTHAAMAALTLTISWAAMAGPDGIASTDPGQIADGIRDQQHRSAVQQRHEAERNKPAPTLMQGAIDFWNEIQDTMKGMNLGMSAATRKAADLNHDGKISRAELRGWFDLTPRDRSRLSDRHRGPGGTGKDDRGQGQSPDSQKGGLGDKANGRNGAHW